MSAFIGQQALAGNVFIGVAPVAGVTIPVAGGTAQTFVLWNPAGSGKLLVLDKLNVGAISGTTPTLGTWVLGMLLNAGSAIGTPISAFTPTTPNNAKLGGGAGANSAPVGRFSVAATTTAVTTFYTLPWSREATTATVGPVLMTHDFDGCVIIPPNVLIALGNTTVQTEPVAPTITWAEVPIV